VEGGIQLIKIWLKSSDQERCAGSTRASKIRYASGSSAQRIAGSIPPFKDDDGAKSLNLTQS
jgi:hypothetical protein